MAARREARRVRRGEGYERGVAKRCYRARKSEAPGVYSRVAVQARIDFYGGRCWICSATAYAMDHVKPLAQGGSNWPANLRPICTALQRSQEREVASGRAMASVAADDGA
jgi:5-methylcytosine-specific restriction endonuclease McrA